MAASDVTAYLLYVETNKEEALRIAEKTAVGLQARDTTLFDVVQSLGQYINDEDSRIRGRAVSYLAAVLFALPPRFLSRQQIEVLCQFFTARVEDVGAVDGLTRLQSLDLFITDMAQTVVRAIFDHFPDFRSRPQSARHQVLQLLNELMSNHRRALQTMGDESLIGFTNLVSGEKDPRNLMLVFSMCRVFMLEWNIANHAETLFDIVYAYFPITFRPPPNDPYGITAQDLKDRLQDCIASTKAVAPYAIPSLLDKLDSTSSLVKRDVLRALLACARSYDASCMSRYSIPLWDALKFEVLNAQEPELAQETLVVLQAIATCLSASHQASPTASPLAQYIRPISKETIEHLQEPSHRQAKASGDILRHVSSATADSFNLVTKAVIPAIVTIYQSSLENPNRRALVEVLGQLFDSAIDVCGTWTSRPALYDADNPIGPFSETLLQMFSHALMSTGDKEVSFRVVAAQGLRKLAAIRNLLQENEIGLIIRQFDELILSGEAYGHSDLRKAALECLAEASTQKPQMILDITLPAFMAQLPDTDVEAEDRADYHSTLEGLAEISIQTEVFNTLGRRLLNKLDVLLATNNISRPRYTVALLSTLFVIMEKRNSEDHINIEWFYDRVVVGLISRATTAAVEGRSLTALNDTTALEALARLSNLIVRRVPLGRQNSVCTNVYSLYSTQCSLDILCQASKSSQVQNLWILSTWLLAAIPRNIQAPLLETDSISHILPRLLGLLEEDIWTMASTALSRQIALYVNKHLPTSELELATSQLRTLYTNLTSKSQQGLTDGQNESPTRTSWTIRTIFVISKALVLRLAPTTDIILGDLISLLDTSRYQPPLNGFAASTFAFLLAPDAVLSKTNGAQIRLLAPQKVFHTLVPLLSDGFKGSSPGDEREKYLTALSGLIATVPSDIVVPELPTLLPLLLQSLDLLDGRVKISTLETLTTVILRSPSVLAESGHISSLTKRLLKISSSSIITKQRPSNPLSPPSQQQGKKSDSASLLPPPPPSPPKARQLATRCLALMPTHIVTGSASANPLLSLKREVLQGLLKVLDDPKRDVRKEAVDARAAWLRRVDDEDGEESE